MDNKSIALALQKILTHTVESSKEMAMLNEAFTEVFTRYNIRNIAVISMCQAMIDLLPGEVVKEIKRLMEEEQKKPECSCDVKDESVDGLLRKLLEEKDEPEGGSN